jgi:tRNA (cytidine/uridine-2'-O-)-methyltransferase
MLRLALYQPDIPQNTGTILRMAACLGLPVELIEPAGFDVSDRNLRRAGLDYLDHLTLTRHVSWRAFEAWRREVGARLVLATTKGTLPYTEFSFEHGDVVLLGRESAGVPDDVHATADARIVVPMRDGMRSLNIAVAAAMVVGEALRQTAAFPSPQRGGLKGRSGHPPPHPEALGRRPSLEGGLRRTLDHSSRPPAAAPQDEGGGAA